jgi:hypothetical integral membrane protein (TIGR02206 family)
MLERYFSKFWFGLPFELFSPPHLISLAAVTLACLAVIGARNHFGPKGKLVFRTSLAVILLGSKIVFGFWLIYIQEAALATTLPLHLCSLFILLSAVMLITRSYPIYEYSYFLGSGGALFALITPDIGMYNFPHFLAVQTIIAHGGLLLAQVYMTAVEGYRPTWQSLWKVYRGVSVYAVLVLIINALIGSNYLFFSYKPDFPTLLDYLGTWPWYIPVTLAAGALICLLLYLPFYDKDHKMKADRFLG